MNVDLPTPGTPVTPTRWALPVCGSSATSSSCARSRWSARRDSTSVIARRDRAPASARARTPVGERQLTVHGTAGRDSVRSRSSAALGDHRAGREDRRGAGRAQRVEVLRRDDAADDDHDVVAALRGQLVAQRGHQGEVAGGERVDADDVHVGLDRLPGHLGRGLEQRADVDVEAQVGERGRDHLLAAVVAVLAHLGHQDARPAALLPPRTRRSRPAPARSCPRRCRPPRGTRRRWSGSVAVCRP